MTSIEKPDVVVEEEEEKKERETPPSPPLPPPLPPLPPITSNQNIKSNLEFPHFFPSPNTFLIDLDPFSSNTSNQISGQPNPFDDNFFDTPSITKNAKVTNPFIDPFDTDEFSSVFSNNNNNNKVKEDPFSVFNTVVNNSNLIKMSSEEDDNTELKFEELDLPKAEQRNQNNEEVNNEKSVDDVVANDDEVTVEATTNSALPKKNKYDYDDSSSDDDDEFQMKSVPPPVKQNSVDIVEIRDSFSETTFNVVKQKVDDDDKKNKSDDEDDMDNAFTSFSNEKVASTVEDLPSLTKEFADDGDGDDSKGITFENFDAAESSTDFNDQMTLAMRKGDTSLETVNVGKLKMSFKNEDDDDDDEEEREKENKINTSKSNLRVDEEKKKNDEAVLSSSNRLEPVDNTKNFNRGVKMNKICINCCLFFWGAGEDECPVKNVLRSFTHLTSLTKKLFLMLVF